MSPSPNHETVAERYAREVGNDALERQKRERGERHPCCGELVSEGHHGMCSKRPTDEVPAHVDGQEALL